MRRALITSLLITFAMMVDGLNFATTCNPAKCKLPNCKCNTYDSGSDIPIEKTPQIVMLTFDDAVTRQTYDLISGALFGLKNPDGCPIGATHFVTHAYCDYGKVHKLWKNGHEIALHSVTHVTDQNYWKDISLETMEAEFGDMQKILGNLAAIPESDIRGVRLPFLQSAGDVTFEALQRLGLLYDSSMPIRSTNPAPWPYTLDFKSTQECMIPPCPAASFPGIWEVPMVTWKDRKGVICSMVDGCTNVPQTEEGLTDWMLEQFNQHYNGTRAPFPVFMHAAWFLTNSENYKAYNKFITHLQSLPDVYIVTLNSAIKWIQNPQPLSSGKPFGECETRVPPRSCVPKTCPLTAPSGEKRWMTSCVKECPKSYPWIGNPSGA